MRRNRKIAGYDCFFYQRKDSLQWVFGYRASSGDWPEHRVPSDIRSRRDAECYAAAWLEEMKKQGERPTEPVEAPPDRGPTLDEVAPRWLQLRERNPDLAASTVLADRSILSTHVLPVLGKTPIAELGSGTLRRFIRGVREKRANYTTRNVVVTLTQLFEDAIAEEWLTLPANPMRHPGVRKEIPPAQPRAGRTIIFIPHGEAEKMLAHGALPADRRARYLIGFLAGLRDGEIAALTWADVDLDGEVPLVRVTKSVAIKGPTGYATVGKTKTETSVRTLALHSLAVAALATWRREGWAEFVGHEPRPSDPIFPNPRGGHARPRSASLIRSDLAAADCATTCAGHPIDFHATRRSFSTWLEAAGVPNELIDRMMGHSGRTVRQRHYTAADLQAMKRAVETVTFKLDLVSQASELRAQVLPPTPPANDQRFADPAKLPAGRGKPAGERVFRPPEKQSRNAEFALVAQWTEQRFPKPKVASSILAGGAQHSVGLDVQWLPEPILPFPTCCQGAHVLGSMGRLNCSIMRAFEPPIRRGRGSDNRWSCTRHLASSARSIPCASFGGVLELQAVGVEARVWGRLHLPAEPSLGGCTRCCRSFGWLGYLGHSRDDRYRSYRNSQVGVRRPRLGRWAWRCLPLSWRLSRMLIATCSYTSRRSISRPAARRIGRYR
jgi:integrase